MSNPTNTHHKTAVLILSDPKAGGEEALGRVFNALAVAHEAKATGEEVAVLFAGPGTRWPAELSKVDHPANALFDSVRDTVQGASCGCAAIFGATEGVQASGLKLVSDYALPGTAGTLSLLRYAREGWVTLVF